MIEQPRLAAVGIVIMAGAVIWMGLSYRYGGEATEPADAEEDSPPEASTARGATENGENGDEGSPTPTDDGAGSGGRTPEADSEETGASADSTPNSEADQ